MADELDLEPEILGDVSLFDESDPKSMVNIVWEGLAHILRHWPKDELYLWNREERTIRKTAKADTTLSLLRVRFWEEYHVAHRKNKKMVMIDTTRGLVVREYWQSCLYTDRTKLVYVLTPPLRYRVRLEGLLDLALEQLGDILSKDTEDPKLIALKVKIAEFIHPLVKGTVTQKLQIDQRVLTQNIDSTDISQIDNRLTEVNKRISAATSRDMIQIEAPKEKETVE